MTSTTASAQTGIELTVAVRAFAFIGTGSVREGLGACQIHVTDDGVGERFGGRRSAEVGGPALVDGTPHGSVEDGRFPGASEAVLEQERDGEEHRGRVGDAAPGDVRRRPVHGLEQARPFVAEARRGRQAEPAGDGGCEVGEDVPEHVLGHDHVELLGRGRELHGRRDEAAPSRASELERAADDALDLRGCVLARVEDRAVLADAAGAE